MNAGFLTTAAAAKRFNVPEALIRRWLRSGRLTRYALVQADAIARLAQREHDRREAARERRVERRMARIRARLERARRRNRK
jgi:hypothetical protein